MFGKKNALIRRRKNAKRTTTRSAGAPPDDLISCMQNVFRKALPSVGTERLS
jgi:hypothetical protein